MYKTIISENRGHKFERAKKRYMEGLERVKGRGKQIDYIIISKKKKIIKRIKRYSIL